MPNKGIVTITLLLEDLDCFLDDETIGLLLSLSPEVDKILEFFKLSTLECLVRGFDE